jgi:hypothetical protein
LATVGDHLLAGTTFLAFLALSAQAVVILVYRRPEDPAWRVGLAYTVLLLTLGTAVWEGFPGAATRVLLPLTLAANLILVRTRASLVWFLVVDLQRSSRPARATRCAYRCHRGRRGQQPSWRGGRATRRGLVSG